MAISKKDRGIVFNKYGGKCAYCGCELQKGWHVDEVQPVRRNYKDEWVNGKWVRKFVSYEHPERMCIENQNPACASCNINKHSDTLENFRKAIKGYMNYLNEISTQFKIAKRYGLITENDIEVKFYFETLTPPIYHH